MNELRQRLEKTLYTLKHRKAFREIEKKYFGYVSFRGYIHDIDKVFLYILIGIEATTRFHRKFAKHHENSARTYQDFKEMAIDWECARYTKEDKPLNAYDTLYLYYPYFELKILPILKAMGVAYSIKNEIVGKKNSTKIKLVFKGE